MKQLQRQILSQILTHNAEAIIVADARSPDFPVIYANPAYERLSGYSGDELMGQCLPLLNSIGLDQHEIEELKAALSCGESYAAAVVDSRKDGSSWVSQVRIEPLYAPRGVIRFFMLSQTNLPADQCASSSGEVGVLQREIRRAREKLAAMNRLEPATGVLRYDYFLELVRRDFGMARRDGRLVAVALFDVIDLDIYCQTFGTRATDSCLRMIAVQVNGALRRSEDLCARADEHSIIALTHGEEIDEVRTLVSRITANVRRLGLHNPRGRHGRYVEIQVGIAGGIPDGNFTPTVAIAQAREDIMSREPVRKAPLKMNA